MVEPGSIREVGEGFEASAVFEIRVLKSEASDRF
jgi:hypothetical protein